MQENNLVFDIIHTLSYPVLILEESENGDWLQQYANEKMENLLREHSHKINSKETEEFEASLGETLLILINRFKGESASDTSTYHDLEIFGTIYNVHVNKNKKSLVLIFVEISKKEIFDNITFHDLSRACNAIIVILDTSGNLVDMNDCFCDMVGMEKESVIGKSFFDNFIPGNKEQLNQYFGAILNDTEYHQHFLTKLKTISEEKYRINWQVSKIIKYDETYIIAVGSDVSKLVDENSNLKQQLKSIKVGFDYFPLAIGYMNSSGIFTTMNPRFKKMFNIKDEQISFDKIPLLKKNIGFEKMNENVKLIKEMSYKIDYISDSKKVKIKVDIRMLVGKKESSKLYIVVVQEIK